ncbi:helix-turn-helix domain-containing protein [Streptomyces sp. NPDC051172]|uniref:helix-turn-helix domain-containing protein n=1 Tax=Streptomyces sp. NPDC051172 TaxID=3155796 RepID=UPI00341B0A59
MERCRTRPIAHAAAEAGVSCACLSTWKSQYDTHGEAGLQEAQASRDPHRPSPHRCRRTDRAVAAGQKVVRRPDHPTTHKPGTGYWPAYPVVPHW